jgi:hypothetical protein
MPNFFMFLIKKDNEFISLLKTKLRKKYNKNRRTVNELIHASDLLDSNCLRKSYYSRKYPSEDVVIEESLFSFIRGEASERIITELSDIGASQVRIERHGIVARPDILRNGPDVTPSDFLVIELKDTAMAGKRLQPEDQKFRSYSSFSITLHYPILKRVCSV